MRIYTTGDICLTGNGKLVRADRLPGRQGRLVFAYLVAEFGRAVSRDELEDMLWPRRVPTAADAGLSAIISKLRAIFIELGVGRGAVRAAAGGYQLSLPAETWIDTQAALESVHLAEAALQVGDVRGAYGPAVVACSILRRPFMAGDDEAWIVRRREALCTARVRALDCLAQIHIATGEHALALRAAEETVELEPFREAGYRRLMLVHDAVGNRAEAVRVYAQLEALLDVELKTTPGPETRRVMEAVAGKSLAAGGE